MNAFFKHQAWLSIPLLITLMSFPLASKAKRDAENDLGPPAGTAGHQQNDESGSISGKLPPGHRSRSINVKKPHPLSEPDSQHNEASRPKIGNVKSK